METAFMKNRYDPREIRKFYNDTQKEIDRCNINVSYPFSQEFDYDVCLRRLDLDAEREKDIKLGRGFIVSEPKPINKELKEPKGIFSTKFGQTLSDTNPFIDRYQCECGQLRSRINNGLTCPYCNTKVKYVDDDFSIFGWLVLKKQYIIHPNLYKSIEFLCGEQTLVNMLDMEDAPDEDGHSTKKNKKFIKKEKGKTEQPFYGIGLIEFRKRFDEIMYYYYSRTSNKASKEEYYKDIMANKDIVFTQSIPVFTTLLRPYEVSDKKKFTFEKSNAIYSLLSKLVSQVNDDSLRMFRVAKPTENLLRDIQFKLQELSKEIDNILSGKKGNVRLLFSGRYSFSSRNVIVQNPKLKIDQITLPYWCLCELLQQRIINILRKSYNMSSSDAYSLWYKANIDPNPIVIEIIEGIIRSNPLGLPVLINRNPTISRGGILQMHCVGMTMTFTLGIPLQVLPKLAADFDGDVLNVYLILNQAFYERAFQVMNPRNSMYISPNDGTLDKDVIHQRDTIINSNTLVRLGRKVYTPERRAAIMRYKQTYK